MRDFGPEDQAFEDSLRGKGPGYDLAEDKADYHKWNQRRIAPQRVRRPYLLKLLADSSALLDRIATGKYIDGMEIRQKSERLAAKLRSAVDREARFEEQKKKDRLV